MGRVAPYSRMESCLGKGRGCGVPRDAAAFRMVFGHPADCEYATDGDPGAPNLTGGALRFANTGGRFALETPDGATRDVLVYKGGSAPGAGWQGPAVYPYRPTSAFPEEGQVLYRKLNPADGRPVRDTDTAVDWASEPGG